MKRELKIEKKWVTPQLIVLMRGKPGEGVLATCKMTSGAAIGPAATDGACIVWHCVPTESNPLACRWTCGWCDEYAAS